MARTPSDPTDILRIRCPRPTRLEGFVGASFAFAVLALSGPVTWAIKRMYSNRLAAIGT